MKWSQFIVLHSARSTISGCESLESVARALQKRDGETARERERVLARTKTRGLTLRRQRNKRTDGRTGGWKVRLVKQSWWLCRFACRQSVASPLSSRLGRSNKRAFHWGRPSTPFILLPSASHSIGHVRPNILLHPSEGVALPPPIAPAAPIGAPVWSRTFPSGCALAATRQDTPAELG